MLFLLLKFDDIKYAIYVNYYNIGLGLIIPSSLITFYITF